MVFIATIEDRWVGWSSSSSLLLQGSYLELKREAHQQAMKLPLSNLFWLQLQGSQDVEEAGSMSSFLSHITNKHSNQ